MKKIIITMFLFILSIGGILDIYISVNKLDDRIVSLETSINELEEDIILPEYWVAPIDNKIADIKALQKRIGFNGTSFAFITDIHWANNSQNSPKLLEKIIKDCEINYYFDGGDFSSNPVGLTKTQQITEIKEYKNAFKNMQNKVLRIIGNHDDNSINGKYSDTITDNEMYDLMFRQNSQYQYIKSGNTGGYYFVDDEMHNIRYITLNCIDVPYVETVGDTLQYKGMDTWAFRQSQIDWFADIALNVPNSNWSVVVCSHIPINQGLIKNDSIVMHILQAFKDKTTYSGSNVVDTDFLVSKTVNYTGKGGDVICWIAGHLHNDSFITLPSEITFKEVITLNDSLHVGSGQPTKTIGTATENSFDIFTIDKATRTVNITRIGAGSDRSFIY